ncbi:hypothetical protein RBA63_13695 [Brenneria goodwinii]|uniref:STM2901 family protein n=1 Tax=Brenneria goodwinii TaxID=1109412 RepID=UPI0036ECB4AC
MDTVEELNGTYFYEGTPNLTASGLFFWIMVDEVMDHFGIHDIAAVVTIFTGQNNIYVPGKPANATPGTSRASKVSRTIFRNRRLPIKLPTVVGYPPKMKIIMTHKLGTFVGRAIPVFGVVVLTVDVMMITTKTVSKYNAIARKEHRLF